MSEAFEEIFSQIARNFILDKLKGKNEKGRGFSGFLFGFFCSGGSADSGAGFYSGEERFLSI